MRTLVTGFGPFGTVEENPSARLAEGSGRPFVVLEVAYAAADAFVRGLDETGFDTLLMLGVASRRDRITPELFARNVREETPDVREEVAMGTVEEGAPLLLESTLWMPGLLATLEVTDDVRTSLDAGAYLCNYVSYRALRRFPQKRVGFLHVPPFEAIPEDRQAAVLADILAKVETFAE